MMTWASRWHRRGAKLARLATFVAAVMVCFASLAARKARARAADAALAFAEALDRVPATGGSLERVRVNGQEVRVGAAHVEATVGEVLDRVEHACATDAEGLGEDLESLDDLVHTAATKSSRPSGPEGAPGIGILRDERADRGVVMCFAAGRETSMSDVARRLSRFAESHDLAAIGALRYVAVRAAGAGAHVTAVVTGERLDLDALTAQTDLPLASPRHLPRPEGAHPWLSLEAAGAPYGVFVYSSPVPPDVALEGYVAELRKRGFVETEATSSAPAGVRALSRANVDAIISVERSNGPTSITVIESELASARPSEEHP